MKVFPTRQALVALALLGASSVPLGVFVAVKAQSETPPIQRKSSAPQLATPQFERQTAQP